MRERDLDDVDAEESCIGIGFRVAAGAAGQFIGLTNAAGAGNIDVDIVLILRINQQRVGVGTATALHGGNLLRIADVGDIEDANAAEAVRAGGRQRAGPTRGRSTGSGGSGGWRRRRRNVAGGQRDALRTAVRASVQGLGGHEHQMAVNRHVALATRAQQGRAQLRARRTVDVVGVDAVVIADEEMVAAESEIGIRGAVLIAGRLGRRGFTGGRGRRFRSRAGGRHDRVARTEAGGLGERGKLLHPERGFTSVIQAAFQTDTRIVRPAARIGGHTGVGRLRRHHRPGRGGRSRSRILGEAGDREREGKSQAR